ncbi:MAG: hypothetical protein FWE62_07140, partial [Firmicutes bacterium]|nr:hypothetical protein [Bacillota bacterium]
MKKLLCILLCLPLFAAYGCGTDDKDGGGKDGGRIADVIFWGAYNTEKVMADDPVPDEPKAADVVMQGMRGETESGQFIMTPDEGFPDFRSYNVTATALSGPDGAEIPAENIEIFMQHYIRTTNRSYPDTADKTAPMYLGWYPDALIPFDRAVSKRKNNITDGLNQGVWINVNIPADAEPGEYEGKLTVTMGEASKDIPVYLKVYDLDFPEELHTRYEFGLYYYMIGTGEGKKSSLELEEAYYWFLANKGLTPHAIPTGGYSTPAQYADYLVQFAASPKVTNYLLPYRGETNAVYGQLLDTNYLVQVLSAMGSKQRALDAEPGNTVNLFKKAGLRLGALTDEPQNAKDVERARECEKRVISAKDQAANSFPEYAADIQRIYSAVALTDISLNVGKGILNLVGDDTDGGLGTWSPTADRWDSRRTYEWQMTGGQWTTGTMKELVDYRRANSGKKNGED